MMSSRVCFSVCVLALMTLIGLVLLTSDTTLIW